MRFGRVEPQKVMSVINEDVNECGRLPLMCTAGAHIHKRHDHAGIHHRVLVVAVVAQQRLERCQALPERAQPPRIRRAAGAVAQQRQQQAVAREHRRLRLRVQGRQRGHAQPLRDRVCRGSRVGLSAAAIWVTVRRLDLTLSPRSQPSLAGRCTRASALALRALALVIIHVKLRQL